MSSPIKSESFPGKTQNIIYYLNQVLNTKIPINGVLGCGSDIILDTL